MTNDKDGAALLREAIHNALSSELGDTYDCGRVWEAWHVGTMGEDDFTPVNDRVDEITETVLDALKSHGQAFDAAGVREAVKNFVDNYFAPWGSWKTEWWESEVLGDAAYCAENALKHVANIVTRALPIPEAPASVEPVAWALRKGNDRELGWADWGRLTDAEKADGWTETPLYARPEPDTIGSNFGNGGGFDPVDREKRDRECLALLNNMLGEVIRVGGDPINCLHGACEKTLAAVERPSLGFGGGDLREALIEARAGFEATNVLIAALSGESKSIMVETFIERIDAALPHDQRGGAGE